MKCNSCGADNVDGARFCATCGATVGEPAAAENTLVGQTIGGRYHVKRVLGEGGMGIVYEAEQQMGSAVRKVAVKTLHAHLSHDPSINARFNRECGTIAGLEHPNTIKVYDFGATPDGTLYIAMEFVAGHSLSQEIEKVKTLPPERVLRLMRQIAGSLEEAHQQGIIHRDLKPDNIVLTDRAGEKDVVKVLDFGIAARKDSADAQREQKLTQQGMVLGTPPYMSPEQFTGKALDARSDVYSLGIMTYEMLTGRLPFDAQTPWQWATEHMTAQPIPFEATPVSAHIPAAMRAAVLRSLAKNRDERQTSAKQFYDELAGDVAIPESASASTGTAAMAAPPGFGNAALGAAKTAAMPTTGAAAAVVTPHTPAIAPPKGGGKGLVIGLAGLGGVLVLGIVIVATRSMKASGDPPAVPAAAVAETTPPPVTKVAAQVDTSEPAPIPVPTPASPPVEERPLEPVAPAHPGKKPVVGSTPGVSKPATPATPPPPAAPAAPAPAANACAACLNAISSGNFGAAASAYNSCADADQKSKCATGIRSGAPSAAKAAAFNGQCPQAKAIMAAGQSVGAPARLFADVAKNCK